VINILTFLINFTNIANHKGGITSQGYCEDILIRPCVQASLDIIANTVIRPY